MIDPEHFLIQEREGLRLIVPKKSSALADSIWTPENIRYRSRVETLAGETVSQGFKKFMNLRQGPEELRVDTADIIRACLTGDAVATVKIDGSLIVRSVYQGRVLLRTRGAFGYEHQENASEVETCTRRYPRLLDPTYLPEYSLLLEWVSPTNVIILKYAQPDLFLVGAIFHRDLRYLRLSDLQAIATDLGVPLVEFFRLDPDGWASLYKSLAADTEREGYVMRIHGEQTLVKVKCAPYLAKHAFKYGMSAGKLVDLWLQAGRPSEQGFVESLSREFDEETIMWALPFITSLFRWVRAVQDQEESLRQEVERCRMLSRKDFALQMQRQLPPRDFAVAMLLWGGKRIGDQLMRQLLEDQIATSGISALATVEE
ncbi:MAG: hypothetical protein HYZ72_03255 [Deltaproteobacteria bacterium]|nr:hypothetical protein [Deltaproteobacteria bacterium]